MQSVSCSIWSRVAVSISFDDNRYTTDTFNGISTIVGYWIPNPFLYINISILNISV